MTEKNELLTQLLELENEQKIVNEKMKATNDPELRHEYRITIRQLNHIIISIRRKLYALRENAVKTPPQQPTKHILRKADRWLADF